MSMKRTRRAGVAAVVAAVAFSMVPGAGRAATAPCLNAFGQTAPAGTFCDPSFKGTVTPTDSPTGQAALSHSNKCCPIGTGNATGNLYGPNKGDVMVRGIVTPATTVRVTLSDGVRTLWRQVTSTATDDPNAGKPAGSFEFTFGPGHFADPTTGNSVNNPSGGSTNKCTGCVWMPGVSDLGAHAATGTKPNSLNPADRGPSTLTVTATTSSETVTTTITKYAATYKDTFSPLLGGACGAPCSVPTTWCHTDGIFGCGDAKGEASISGFAWDDDNSTYGHGSEIADVILTVTQGANVVEKESIISNREGPVARWNHTAKIGDYEPNCVDPLGFLCGDPYVFTVTVVDAWGNSAAAGSGDVYIYPY
jgi:hypothetical protein